MLEKVIHEDSTRYIVESLQDGMNKRETAGVYTPAFAVYTLTLFPHSILQNIFTKWPPLLDLAAVKWA